MRKVNFILGIHNHQPVGNFQEVFEMAYRKAYGPFMEVMKCHPSIKWSLHSSGILWDFMMDKHPEYIDDVIKMVRSGQIELLTGGYYEPIMTVIPDRDKIGQIRKLTALLKEVFGFEAKGMWLAERVWEPHLARILAETGISYTVVDDAHFAASGLDVEKLRGYYVTEEQNLKLNIFPISQRLRYYIPFAVVEKSIEYFGSCATEAGNNVLVMADDGEKFGLWPETNKHVYGDRWLDNFLSAIENNLNWIEPVTFSEYTRRYPPEGRIYLPTASYFEMSEWSLPANSQEEFEGVVKQFGDNSLVKRFLRGGFWRNFLTKYPESNSMQKKMAYVSAKIASSKKQPSGSEETTKDLLYAGQCNCAYWHGVFGGLYLPHLRTAIYQKLIEAEAALGAHEAKSGVVQMDFDCDGRDEVLYESRTQNLYFSPHSGGTLFEWDIISKRLNLQNVLTRRQEAYHKRLREFLLNPQSSGGGVQTIHDLVQVKEKNLDQYLNYDWYRRASLIDHFIHPDTKFDDFVRSKYGEQGDFVLGEYEFEASARKLLFKRAGVVWDGDKQVRIELTKEVIPLAPGFRVKYRVTNLENRDVSVLFAPEFNVSFSCHDEKQINIIKAADSWERNDCNFDLSLRMEFSTKADIWQFPIETVSLSESGFEKTYQGTVIAVLKKLDLKANSSETFEIKAEIGDSKVK